MIVVQCAHHTRPGLREHQVSLAFALDLNSALVQQRGLHTKEGEGLRRKQLFNLKIKSSNLKLLTADPGFMGVAPGSGVMT